MRKPTRNTVIDIGSHTLPLESSAGWIRMSTKQSVGKPEYNLATENERAPKYTQDQPQRNAKGKDQKPQNEKHRPLVGGEIGSDFKILLLE